MVITFMVFVIVLGGIGLINAVCVYPNGSTNYDCPRITTDLPPFLWKCGNNVIRNNLSIENINNTFFEGDKIKLKVLVANENGINKIQNVFGDLSKIDGTTQDYIIQCSVEGISNSLNLIDPSCDAHIMEEKITNFDKDVMSYYICNLTIESSKIMQGEYSLIFEADDMSGISATNINPENILLNPISNNSSLNVNPLDLKKCISSCLKNKRNDSKQCETNFSVGSRNCRMDYNNCLNNNRHQNNRTIKVLKNKNCNLVFNNCRLNASSLKKDCKNNIIMYCNDQCIKP